MCSGQRHRDVLDSAPYSEPVVESKCKPFKKPEHVAIGEPKCFTQRQPVRVRQLIN